MLCGGSWAVNHSLPGEFATSPVRIVATGQAPRYNPGMDLRELFLKQKEAIRNRSREVFALLRPEHFQWRPEKDALSAGEMLRHLWVSEEGVRRVALEGNFAYYETRIPQGLRAVIGAPTTLGEELKQIERVHLETLAAVRALPPERFDEERTHAGLGFRRNVSVILFGINEHEIHHRAQLMTYLRMLGTPAPEPFRRR
jgi:uncharacterized damage-inducible protein DinB